MLRYSEQNLGEISQNYAGASQQENNSAQVAIFCIGDSTTL